MTEARLWHNGRIFTGRRYVEALLIENGRTTIAGSAEEARRSAPTGVEVVDLAGRLVIPGLIDSHLHIAELTRVREGLDVRSVRSLTQLIERVRAWAGTHSTGPVVGRGWDAERWVEKRWPTRSDLDRALADRPLVLYHASGHVAVVNSAALEETRVNRSTPDPPGGRIGRSVDGEPDGCLYEDAIRAVGPVVAEGIAIDDRAIGRTLRAMASLGLTTGTTMNAGPEEVGALRRLAEQRELPIRVRLYLRLGDVERIAPSSLAPAGPEGMHRVTGVKAFTDGAFGPRTAWLSEPYADAPDESGVSVGTDEELARGLDRAASARLAPALHAIGDRAVVRALRLLAPYSRSTEAPARIEHAALTPPEVFPLLDEVRPVLAVQPGFVWSDAWLRDRLGPVRARWAYAFRSLADRGHVLAGSSDAPYDPVDPWRGLAATVRRRDPEGRSANPTSAETVPPEEAIQMYSEYGGRALGEPELGHLEPGARADLLVLAAPTLDRALAGGSATVAEVWVDGRRFERSAGARDA